MRGNLIGDEAIHESSCRNPHAQSPTQHTQGFHRLYIEQALPLLQRWNFDVVAHGPSQHDENTYYVIHRQREQMKAA